MKPSTSRLDKLVQHGKTAPLMPVVSTAPASVVPEKPPTGSRVARISVSMPPAEADRIEVLAKEVARATGDKPTTSELVRAGLELLAGMSAQERHATLSKMAKLR